MAGKKYVETYRKSPIGWFCTILFWIANGSMVVWFLLFLRHTIQFQDKHPDAMFSMGIGMLFLIWVPIAVVTYILKRST